MPVAAKSAVTGAVILIAVIFAGYLSRVDLASDRLFLPRCSLHTLTGLHCPGCGNTRATQALLQGHVGEALEQNVLFVIAAPFLLFAGTRAWIAWVFPGRLRPLGLRWKWGYSLTLIGIVVLFGILRNLPMPPFDWLAPIPVPAS